MMKISQQAMIFAARAHDGQYRKGTDIPYIIHPFEVVQILSEVQADEIVLCAGYLHDVVEDTEVSISQIENIFGKEIAGLVAHHTEDKSLAWEERKTKKIEALKGAPLRERLLTCADKLSNMRSIEADYEIYGNELWQRFCRGVESQKWYYGSIIERLESLKNYNMYQELVEIYSRVF